MSGRHRRTQITGARRALAGTVPALGLAGVVAAAAGSSADTTPEASGSAPVEASTPVPAPVTPVALDQEDLGIGPDITTVASDAARAAGQAGEQQRVREQQSIAAVVDGLQDDARYRELAATQEGRNQIGQFQQQAEQLRKAEDEKRSAEHRSDDDHGSGEDDRYGDSCTMSAMPHMGHSADSDEIVDRDCGLVDLMGKQRSSDSWIDGQLLSAQGDG